MQASHGKGFARAPDLQEFEPDRSKRNEDGYDITDAEKLSAKVEREDKNEDSS
jgi:hypothetical protein